MEGDIVMIFEKSMLSINETRAQERMRAMVEKQAALLEYVAIMSDVELPENAEGETENE